jgi:Na+/H+ antiporter NhaD/arsenite permease-like protein
LLGQFIAASTLSMGLLIGSPTNIIIVDAMEIDLFTYFSIMMIPAVTAFNHRFF